MHRAGTAGTGAGIVKAETILPPGQSGFVATTGLVEGSGSPHLYDQLQPFIGFKWKPALFGQPGSTETPKAGVSIVRDSYGVPAITDGPYIEAKEYIGSFSIIDCESLERALEIAARAPSARYGAIEVRPIMHESAVDM